MAPRGSRQTDMSNRRLTYTCFDGKSYWRERFWVTEAEGGAGVRPATLEDLDRTPLEDLDSTEFWWEDGREVVVSTYRGAGQTREPVGFFERLLLWWRDLDSPLRGLPFVRIS